MICDIRLQSFGDSRHEAAAEAAGRPCQFSPMFGRSGCAIYMRRNAAKRSAASVERLGTAYIDLTILGQILAVER